MQGDKIQLTSTTETQRLVSADIILLIGDLSPGCYWDATHLN